MSRVPATSLFPTAQELSPGSAPATHLERSLDVSSKVARIVQNRSATALKQLTERIGQSQQQAGAATPQSPWDGWADAARYALDLTQRSVIFWDTLRERGNNFIEHERQGMPPVLHFEYEMIMDGRTLEPAANYALLRIIAPQGVTVDPALRPYLIIDPRGGHGPGIGGFKDDSQVGVALRAGHPVYFVAFFPQPVPGQTLLDVREVERAFVGQVRALHPGAPKPAVVGNCQGGWAAMMLAAASPDATGPVVVVGAPMSYWGGAWSEGAGDNPMRYAGGLLGGAWLASATSDLGAGKFDGAWLVQNFENLNPANTFWDKYRHLFANIDTEPCRFLEFERWWGGYFLLNGEEIEWITQNLFVGNQLWSGDAKSAPGGGFDLRDIKVPIVLFASKGDNITPPQQAFNWVADVYSSSDEIKLRGQVIVGLMHEDIGHLGIFVSGKVATKEHSTIVSVLDSIEALPPGLYGMQIVERPRHGDQPEYDVSFVELRLEEVATKLNRFERDDEQVFDAVKAVSGFNQRVYEMFGRPWLRACANEASASLARKLHPMRLQRWACSDLNPMLWWLAPAARTAREQRQALAAEHPLRRAEDSLSESVSAMLDGYRALRDGASEAAFFHIYGQLHAAGVGRQPAAPAPASGRDSALVEAALASVGRGGYPEALARVAYLMGHDDAPLPLTHIQLAHELIEEYRPMLPDLPMDQVRRIGGEQEIIARYATERAIETLPDLLSDPDDRQRLLKLLDCVLADRRIQQIKPSKAQKAMLTRLREVLGATAPGQAHAMVA